MDYKICTKCGGEKSADPEFFNAAKNGKFGFASVCRDCMALWREKYKEIKKIKDAEYREIHKEQIKKRQKEWRIKNRAEQLLKKKSYYIKNKEKYLAKNKEWKDNSPEKNKLSKQVEYIKNRDKYIKRAKEWAIKNPEKARISGLISVKKRIAIKFGLEEHFTKQDIDELYEEQGGKCYYCGVNIPPYHIEHKTPLSRGGTDTKENLCLSCGPCNWAKLARTEEEFYKYLLLKEQCEINKNK